MLFLTTLNKSPQIFIYFIGMDYLRRQIFQNQLLADQICKNIPLPDLLEMKHVSHEFYIAHCSHVSGLQKLDLNEIEGKVCKL